MVHDRDLTGEVDPDSGYILLLNIRWGSEGTLMHRDLAFPLLLLLLSVRLRKSSRRSNRLDRCGKGGETSGLAQGHCRRVEWHIQISVNHMMIRRATDRPFTTPNDRSQTPLLSSPLAHLSETSDGRRWKSL